MISFLYLCYWLRMFFFLCQYFCTEINPKILYYSPDPHEIIPSKSLVFHGFMVFLWLQGNLGSVSFFISLMTVLEETSLLLCLLSIIPSNKHLRTPTMCQVKFSALETKRERHGAALQELVT